MIRYLAKKILQYYLYLWAKITLWRNRPFVIAVAGTTNKTFTKQAIESFLKTKISLQALPGFNTEIGLPLAILGLKSGYNSYKRWLPTIVLAPFRAFWLKLPKIAVFEFGSSYPGDLAYLTKIAPPKIVVITSITQRYLEQFGGIDKVAKEYEILVKSVKRGLVVLNFDIPEVKRLQAVSQVITNFFGVSEKDATQQKDVWLITNFKTTNQGISGQLVSEQQVGDFNLPRFGRHHALAYAAASAVFNYLIDRKVI